MDASTPEKPQTPVPIAAPPTHGGFAAQLEQAAGRLGHPGEALTNIAAQIPGFAGYKAVEDRRTADKQLRAFIGERLESLSERLDAVIEAQSRGGNLDGLALIDQSKRRLARLIDRMRFADYGYAAVFDRVQIGEAELDRLYTYDAAIVDDLKTFDEAVGQVEKGAADRAALAAALAHLDSVTAGLDRRFDGRKHLFDGLPTG